MRSHKQQGLCLSVAIVAALVGCEPREHASNPAEAQAHAHQPAGDERPLGKVEEFGEFTLRANVSPSEALPEAMARQHGIEAQPDLFLLNFVILRSGENLATPVLAQVSAHYESLIGHAEDIEMRAVDTNGLVSYIGSFDASGQQVFRIVIDAQPVGTNAPLRMNFDVQLKPAHGTRQ